jgi:glycine reductase complex component B subunit gamma
MMTSGAVRVVQYLNQFFGQLGGEAEAGVAPRLVEGPVGPGLALKQSLGEAAQITHTVICGDNYFAEDPERALSEILALVRQARPDVLVAGPAFSAGRYGIACGRICQAAQSDLGLVAVTGLADDSPAVDIYRQDVVIVATGSSAAGMRSALSTMASLALNLHQGIPLGPPDVDGYISSGLRLNVMDERTGAERAVSLLLAKLEGAPVTTEIPLPQTEDVPRAPDIEDLSTAWVALATTGGLVPTGNPDRLRSHSSDRWGSYSIAGLDGLHPDQFEAFHGGFLVKYVNEDPNRLLPLDALDTMVKDGRLGGVHPTLYTIAGNGTSPALIRKMVQEIAPDLKANHVQAVLVSST